MKTKNLLLTFVLVNTIVLVINAQTYQPFPTDSASWKVVRCFYFYQPGWHDEYTFIMDGTDTIHNGLPFKKINISKHHLPGTAYDSIYPTEFFGGLRELDKQIFIWKTWASTDTTVRLVYDFNHTNIGDTIYTNALTGNPNPFGHLITGKDSVLVGTLFHKRLHLQDPLNIYNTEDWIEGVGSSWGLPFATFWSATDNSYDLTCYYQAQQLKYGNPYPIYGYCQAPLPVIICDSALSFVKTLNNNFIINIFPNPTPDKVTVYSLEKIKAIEIYNMLGEKVCTVNNFSQQISNEINLSGFQKGIYFAKIYIGENIYTKKIVYNN